MMKGVLVLFISLAIGYVLCVLADKQKGLLRTVGYTLGIAILTLSLLYSVADSSAMMCRNGKSPAGHKAMKCHPGMFMKGRVK